VEERKIKLSIHFQRRESLGGNEKKKPPIPKEKKVGSKINKRIKYPPKL
jgi:hypothetical protein